MTSPVDVALGAFTEQDLSARGCRTLLSVVPGARSFVFYSDTAGAAARSGAALDEGVKGRVSSEGADASVARALWVADALDKADKGLAAYSGAASLFRLFTGASSAKRRVFESDTQPSIDAVLKALGLSHMAGRLLPGDLAEKAARFLSLPAGREALIYYTVAKVRLPFADNLAEGGAA